MKIKIYDLDSEDSEWNEKCFDVNRIPLKEELIYLKEECYIVRDVINDVEKSDEIILLLKKQDYKEDIESMGQTKESFGSAELLLQTFLQEKSSEQNKLHNMYSRAGVMIAFISGLVIYFNQIVDFETLIKLELPIVIDSIKIVLIILSFLGVIIGLVFALVHFIKVVNIDGFTKLDYLKFGDDRCNNIVDMEAKKLFNDYKKILEENEKVINNKVKNLRKGYHWTIITVICILLNLLINRI